MFTYQQTIGSDSFRRAWMLMLHDKPIYARVDGKVRPVDAINDGQIMVDGVGLHDVIFIDVSDAEGQEA